MTISQASQMIGKEGFIRLGELNVRVRILDVKNRFGNTDYQISPVGGSGNQWVLSGRVNPICQSVWGNKMANYDNTMCPELEQKNRIAFVERMELVLSQAENAKCTENWNICNWFGFFAEKLGEQHCFFNLDKMEAFPFLKRFIAMANDRFAKE